VTFVRCKDNGTHTEIEFSRKYDTGDSAQDVVIAKGNIKVIWALGVSDDITQEHGETRRGVVTTLIRAADSGDSGAWSLGASMVVVFVGALAARFI